MRTRLLTLGAAAVAVTAVAWLTLRANPAAEPPAATPATATAPVTRGDVVQRVQVAGTLGFDGAYQVVNQLPPGIVTALAATGTTVARGGTLFTVSGVPALLLYGAGPAYRDFAIGMTDGPDVRQLEQNLAALGLHPSTVDNHFGTATANAIRRWQATRGVPRTGRVPLGQVVFLPGEVRITQAMAGPGASVGPGTPILSTTSTTHVVTVPLTTDRQHLLRLNNEVQVLLPNGNRAITGTVTAIGRVAAATPATPGGANQATVPVTIAVRLPEGSGDLDQTPVQVAITTARRDNVLMVPVTALLARIGGGYQVRTTTAGLVDVQPGLYDDAAGTVEVTGEGLREGMTVEVPAV